MVWGPDLLDILQNVCVRACVSDGKSDIRDERVEQGKDWKVVLVGTGEMRNGSEWVRKVMLVEREESPNRSEK